MDRPLRIALFLGFVATVYGANWALARYGTVPVGLGWQAPAGVYFAGLAFGLRDLLHELGGARWVLAAVAAGTALAYIIEDAVTIPGGHWPIAAASAVAFAASELLDLAVYAPLRERAWVAALVASNLVGALVDSVVFLWLAFGAVTNMGGNMLGKALMILPVLPMLAWWRATHPALVTDT